MCKCNIQITEAAVFWLKLKCVLHKCQIIKTLNTFFSVNENCDAKIIIPLIVTHIAISVKKIMI